MLPDIVVIKDRAPDAVIATAATVTPVPEDDLSAEDLAALTAIEQAYANRVQVITPTCCYVVPVFCTALTHACSFIRLVSCLQQRQ